MSKAEKSETMPLCFRLGITGHRAKALEHIADTMLELSLKVVLDEVVKVAHKVCQHANCFYSSTPKLTLVSALAEGADRIGASQALASGWTLHAVLPFSQTEYSLDFSNADSVSCFESLMQQAEVVTELNIDRSTAQLEGYENVGKLLARNCDLLLAIWDGKPARGPGGTAWVVEQALQEGVPVIWLDTSNGLRVHGISPLQGIEQGNWQLWLGRQIEQITTPPDAIEASTEQHELMGFISTSPDNLRRGWLFPIFQWFMYGRRPKSTDFVPPDSTQYSANDWQQFVTGTAANMPDVQGSQLLHRHYVKADLMASAFAQRYRGATVLNYVLASCAVLMALMGLILKDMKLIWILLEILIIGGMLLNTRVGKTRRWHEKWLNFRLLAEQLRIARYFCLIGANSLKQTRWLSEISQGQSNSWVNWYLGAVCRQVTLPKGQLSKSCLRQFRQGLKQQLVEQINYHHYTSEQARKAEHRLHILGEVCLYGTLVACFVYLGIAVWFGNVAYGVATWITFTTALLPAFGAASYGLRAHGDFEGIAHRSEVMANQLANIQQSLDFAEHELDTLLSVSDTIRQVKIAELRDWRVTFERKPLAIPG